MKRPSWKSLLLLLFVILGISIAFVALRQRLSVEEPVNTVAEDQMDIEYRQLVVGTWEDDYKGRRTMTVREDGTATMIVELTGLNALFASKMIFEEEWVIRGGRLQLKAIGGVPTAKVDLILKTMGDTSVFEILSLTADQMHLLDADGQTEYNWRRAN